MKRIAERLFLAGLMAAFLMGASDYARAGEWGRTDTALEVAFSVAALADAATTADIRNHSDLYEGSPITRAVIGRNPGAADTALYFAGMTALHAAVSYALPPKARRVWQYVTVTVEGAYAVRNVSMGLRWGF